MFKGEVTDDRHLSSGPKAALGVLGEVLSCLQLWLDVYVLSSSLNSGDTCMTERGASSESDRDRVATVVSSLMSYLDLISYCGPDQVISIMLTLSRLSGRLD